MNLVINRLLVWMGLAPSERDKELSALVNNKRTMPDIQASPEWREARERARRIVENDAAGKSSNHEQRHERDWDAPSSSSEDNSGTYDD